ncbi:MAG: RimK family alpha-L-glutamate ligase [Zestosphaera sp.]
MAVIHEAPVPPQSARELLTELLKRGASVLYLRISRLNSEVLSDGGLRISYGTEHVLEIDGGLVRGVGSVTSMEALLKRVNTLRQLEMRGVTLMNSAQGFMNARDKYRATQLLANAGLRVPETKLTEDVYVLSETVRNWGRAVFKPLIGSMGYGSLLVTDPDVAFIIGKTWLSHSQPVLLQRYMRSKDRDIRVFVVGGEVLGAIYRYKPENTWKTNVAQGAKVEGAVVDVELKELSIKATEALGLDYAGVDVGETEEGYVIYEVNAMPNWQGFYAGTGISPAPKIVECLFNKLRK